MAKRKRRGGYIRGACEVELIRRDLARDERRLCGERAILRRVSGQLTSVRIFLCSRHTHRRGLRGYKITPFRIPLLQKEHP
jgi:hypothetical protein